MNSRRMRNTLPIPAWIFALLAMLPAVLPAQHIAYTTYPVPTPNSFASAITAGPDGAMWFTEGAAGKIGRITTTGTITEFPISAACEPYDITTGPDGALWITCESQYSVIVRMTTSGEVTSYPAPSGQYDIVAGPDGALWFAGFSYIGRITTSGIVTQYPLANEPWAFGITAGPDGALWFTEVFGNNIGRISTSGDITEYPIPTPDSQPFGIAAGPDGALWFEETNGPYLGRITTSGIFTQYLAGDEWAIAAGPDGALWFGGGGYGRITTSGVTTYYPLYVGSSGMGIAAGPDGAMWLTQYQTNEIIRVPACGLGLSTSFANGTLTMTFDLGITTPATFNILLRDAKGSFAEPFSKAIQPAVPPKPFSMQWTGIAGRGPVTVQAVLTGGPGDAICSESQTVNTGQ